MVQDDEIQTYDVLKNERWLILEDKLEENQMILKTRSNRLEAEIVRLHTALNTKEVPPENLRLDPLEREVSSSKHQIRVLMDT